MSCPCQQAIVTHAPRCTSADALVLLPAVQVAVWDGHFDLRVSLEGRLEGIDEVAAATVASNKYAELLVVDPGTREIYPVPVPWINGEPFVVQVRCSGRTSGFGRETDYYQHQLLILRITYRDGAVKYIPAEIPDGRVTRRISVSIPERQPKT
jgi:hypothetical protein